MRYFLIVLFGTILLSCNQSTATSSQSTSNRSETKLGSFDWMLGQWQRLNEEEGKETFENWERVTTTEYVGIGFTMENGDTIKQEGIRLTKTDANWQLEVRTPEESESTIFPMTSFSEKDFTCENHEIEFPNKIRYWIDGDNMYASVSSADFQIAFEFVKLSK